MPVNPLGQTTQYISEYKPSLLFPIPRSEKRNELEQTYLDFEGEDIWNAYELSWLNQNGVPQVAIAEFRFPVDSLNIVESKSLKLYLNSFNQTRFESVEKVTSLIKNDLSEAVMANVGVSLYSAEELHQYQIKQLEGRCIDQQSIEINHYEYDPSLLSTDSAVESVNEVLKSNLLKSNCLITSQPDWASIQIKYVGPKINEASLLRYLVSFRSHNEFHEQCVERIFADINEHCRPDKLTVYARYTRRGGLDINPWRSNYETSIENLRTSRQ